MPVDSAETPVESPSDTPLGTPNHKQQVKVLFYNVFFLYSIIIIAYFQWRIHKLLGRGMKKLILFYIEFHCWWFTNTSLWVAAATKRKKGRKLFDKKKKIICILCLVCSQRADGCNQRADRRIQRARRQKSRTDTYQEQ